MALVVISIDRNTLPPHTDADFEAWVKYEIGDTGGISLDNPLSEIDLEASVREISR